MQWLFDHFQFVAVIVIVLASLAKHLKGVAQTEEDERQAREEMADDEEVIRPGHERPIPQPPVLRKVTPRIVIKGSSPFVRTGTAPAGVGPSDEALILQQQQDIQERLRQIRDTKATTTGGAAATRTRVSAAQRHPKAVAVAKTGLHASLHSHKQIRRAIVMREILGPPVGLR